MTLIRTNQQRPVPGTALTAFLKRHERDLRDYHDQTGDRIALSHAEMCCALLEDVRP